MNEGQAEYYIPGNYYYRFSESMSVSHASIISTWKYIGLTSPDCDVGNCYNSPVHEFQPVSSKSNKELDSAVYVEEDSIDWFLSRDDLLKTMLAQRLRTDIIPFIEDDQVEERRFSYSPSSSGGIRQFNGRNADALKRLNAIEEPVDLLLIFPPEDSDVSFISEHPKVEGVQFIYHLKSIENLWQLTDNLNIKSLTFPIMFHLPPDFYDWLASFSALEFLTIEQHDVVHREDDQINECLINFPNLLSLSLRNSHATSEIGMGLETCRHLTELDLTNTQVDDGLFEYDLNWEKLDSLCLDETSMTDESLNKIKRMKNLRSLSLNHVNLTDESIPAIKELSKLESLSLGFNRMSVQGLYELISSMKECAVYYTYALCYIQNAE